MSVRFSVLFSLLLLWSGLLTASPPLKSCQEIDQKAEKTLLAGTFLQLRNEHVSWEANNWKALFSYFRELELTELVIQWSVYDDTNFYQKETSKPLSPLETILRFCEERKIDVFLGLYYDSQFWNKLQRDPSLVKVYLHKLRLRSREIALETLSIVRQHQSFKGWYITEEIDDRNWLEPSRRDLLLSHLQQLISFLRGLSPDAEVAISGFSSGFAGPSVFQEFWSGIVNHVDLDRIYFQDSMGTGRMDRHSLPLYLGAMQRATNQKATKLQVVVELFEQLSPDHETFKAVPADFERIRFQLESSSCHSSLAPVAFSVPEYMSPLGGDLAARVYRDYLTYADRRH